MNLIREEILAQTSGIVLRSSAVGETKDILVEADVHLDGKEYENQTPLRLDRLGSDTLIALFAGSIQNIKIQ